MLNKISSLNYKFSEAGEVTEVSIGFNSYTNAEVSGNLNVKLLPEDGELATLSPNDLKDLAKVKALAELAKED